MKKLIFILPLIFVGCAGRPIRVLNASWVSMKNKDTPDTSRLTRVGPVQSEYCMNTWKSGTFGLMDEAVRKAEEEHRIDYIKGASFDLIEGKNCAQVAGDGYRYR